MKIIIALITAAALSSCAGVVGSFAYQDPKTGAKGAIILDGTDTPKWQGSVPILDADGREVGRAEFGTVTSTK